VKPKQKGCLFGAKNIKKRNQKQTTIKVELKKVTPPRIGLETIWVVKLRNLSSGGKNRGKEKKRGLVLVYRGE